MQQLSWWSTPKCRVYGGSCIVEPCLKLSLEDQGCFSVVERGLVMRLLNNSNSPAYWFLFFSWWTSTGAHRDVLRIWGVIPAECSAALWWRKKSETPYECGRRLRCIVQWMFSRTCFFLQASLCICVSVGGPYIPGSAHCRHGRHA